jgi:hypothetical protein
MAEIKIERDFEASADRVWKKLGAFGELDWMPGVGSVEVEGEGVGAIRRIAMGAATIVEKLEAHDNGARSLSYSITEGPIPVQNYLATICVSETEGGCHVDWSARFELPDGVPAEAITGALEGAYGGALDHLKGLVGD